MGVRATERPVSFIPSPANKKQEFLKKVTLLEKGIAKQRGAILPLYAAAMVFRQLLQKRTETFDGVPAVK